jgi:serralysin
LSDDVRVPPKRCWCFAWFMAPPARTTNDKIGLLRSSQWQSTDAIRIAFRDGTPEQIALVKRFSVEWITGLANLSFSWVSNLENSDVRITFRFPGSWSVIGTTCKDAPKTSPTMNFGWLTPGVTDDVARRVILHEFGHALGFVHEHQRMDENGWDKDAVIHDLSRPPNHWDRETIDHNMFDTFPGNSVLGTELDRTSIMMYPVPAHWRNDGLSAELNANLSAADRRFAKQMYS